MASPEQFGNPEHLAQIKKGVENWNEWRRSNSVLCHEQIKKGVGNVADLLRANLIDLRGANLEGADLRRVNFGGVDLRMADLSEANLSEANCCGANLRSATLSRAYLENADFRDANLCVANLTHARLHYANLSHANLSGANLAGAQLIGALLIGCNLESSDITGSWVYGVSVWDASLARATQRDLVITLKQPHITVDNLEVAQFIYLLLNNAKIREIIDAIATKAILILGRFTPKRKRTLDTLRDALRARNYLPIVFDFEKPAGRDFTETASTLAHLARFVIADLTDPRSIPQELMAIIPRLLSVPIRPLLLGNQKEWVMFNDLLRYPQVIAPFHYTDDAMLLSHLETQIIDPAERMAQELTGR